MIASNASRRLAARKLMEMSRTTMNSRTTMSKTTMTRTTMTRTTVKVAAAAQQPSFSTNAAATNSHKKEEYQPMGDLFQLYAKDIGANKKNKPNIGEKNDLVGKTASIRRVFGPNSNAQTLLVCGGELLAQKASFDPDYEQAKTWIRSRPIGPAVLSSTLVSGLLGALIEASFPQTIPLNSNTNFLHPLIVGMEVEASIKVESFVALPTKRSDNSDENTNNVPTKKTNSNTTGGYEILLSTKVNRVQDNVTIAQGHHTVWIPGYL